GARAGDRGTLGRRVPPVVRPRRRLWAERRHRPSRGRDRRPRRDHSRPEPVPWRARRSPRARRRAPARGRACRLAASRVAVRACVHGWGTAVPEQLLTNADLERRVDTTDAWIVERTGIRERHIAAATDTTASMAIDAGTNAIKHAGIPPDAVDLLIVATATPEQPIPHTGAFVGESLGLRCGSFPLRAGCAGFVYLVLV